MDGSPPPLLSPSIPRFAPLRTHTRTPSRSPTRPRLADDILSDLSPVTTLEAFTNPSGKLKASIEAATPSERAFGLRATLASKKIQEWVDELSGWPWPAGGGSLGFEIPYAKRRKLSVQGDDRGRRNSNGYAQEQKYIGSLLETEVERYEIRIDDITADMEDLNVEEIKRQVLDTHFSPRSRPSSSSSNAPPMPSLFASFTRMDDFTAVVTATVLQSLPNLSRLTRLMDVWNIRLSVLRKVPPLMLALDDAEVALKSGWTAINKPDTSQATSPQPEDLYLTRKAFEIMRGVLQDKVTTLGQDLDYMLDTLEGREDTLPDSWLDRMETLENDYGSWVVSGDRKVREGEWARMAKARKVEDDARKLKGAEAAETARRKEEEESRLKAHLDAEKAEAARFKAEQEAQEAARLQALRDIQEVEEADVARRKAEDDVKEAARLEVLRKAQEVEATRLLAEQVEMARRQAEEKAQVLACQKALQKADEAENTRPMSEQEADTDRLQEEEQAREMVNQGAIDDAAKVEAARLADEQARAEARDTAQQALKDAELAESGRFNAVVGAQETVEQQALEEEQRLKATRLLAQQAAEEERQAAAFIFIEDPKITEEITDRTAQLVADKTESKRQLHQAELAVQKSGNSESMQTQVQLDTEAAAIQPRQDVGDVDTSRQSAHTIVPAVTEPEQDIDIAEHTKSTFIPLHIGEDESDNQRITDCDICEEIRQSKPNSPSRPGTGSRTSSRAVGTQSFRDTSITSEVDRAVNPQITRYAPFDGGSDSTDPAIRRTEVEVKDCSTHDLDLASPIHFDDSFPQTPTSSTVSGAARVFTSPTSEESSPPRPKVWSLSGLASIVRVSSPRELSLAAEADQAMQTPKSPSSTPQTPNRAEFAFDGANDDNDSGTAQKTADEDWIVVESPGGNPKLPNDTQEHSDPESLNSNSRSSVVFGYSTSEPTPEIFEAQPAEYFTSPMRSPRPVAGQVNPNSPTAALPATPKLSVKIDSQETTPTKSPPVASKRHSLESTNSILSPVAEEYLSRSTELDVDGPCDACEVAVRDLEANERISEDTDLPILARKTSRDSPIREISIPRRESISSNASTIHGRVGESPSSVASPVSEDAMESSFEQSPSAGRIGHRSVKSYDISPPNSPPPGIARRPSLFPATPGLSPSTEPTTPLPDSMPPTPLDAPLFGNIDVSTGPIITSPKKSTDDQMQQQISSLLESIPARIRLTTEPDETPFTSQTLRPKKTRRSITPSFRSSSSMSNYSTTSRAPTPSFTLAPAFGKTSSRPRPQSSNPEIKLYHLSRSTGEAPIKLFVRLVGEHGERVMVRVGGGWADLGEYLKEYASHHGRRSAVDAGDKVQIQDLPSRNVSSSSTATLRGNGNGRSTPDPPPQSVMERERDRDRPGSSLFVRKTRRSVGESSSSSSSASNQIFDSSRAPSTPLPSTSSLYRNSTATPPSTTSSSTSTSGGPSSQSQQERDRTARSSSRLSWTSDDGNCSGIGNVKTPVALGLAGPKSKNVMISERDQEWVESMKEKVRLASAEKERRDRDSGVGMGMGGGVKGSGRESRASFGEMEKVGGTKRLFRKGL
ncbi:hypothetical protein ONS95_012873 [Cadophora gregata]|uniref:uncharacterized protein n=1 Tax=Cadophora gregata TaxID=51156 RepID=UPI0026DAEB67|nr:uncharacterized protein ONS95_012873 [Cadophora gregata]KAK0101146.1 hypothetical protein ONS96_006370 [Cadophora gregata f. sp. sojae]KAK0115822.1 hypothetical protein ONS95_012873 [Cadophora gregata]